MKRCLLFVLLLASGWSRPEAIGQETSDEKRVACSLRFVLVPKPAVTKIDVTLLVPKTLNGKQKILALRYSQRPEKEFEENGNKYARFVFTELQRPVDISVDVDAVIYRYDFAVASSSTKTRVFATGSELKKYLVHETYLEKDAREIQEAARGIAAKDEVGTLRDIMNFVQKSLKYSGYNPRELGALGALRDRQGDCTEFSDLFVAVCRARNIPARTWEGYVTTEVKQGDTAKHNWIEVFTKEYGWVPFDPLYVARRSATFERLKPVYLYLTSTRNDPVLQNGHFYRYNYQGKGAEVRDTFLVK